MIDYGYDEQEVRWYMREIEHIACEMQSSWEEVTVESLARELVDDYQLLVICEYDDILEMCSHYLQRYRDPFDGLGYVPSDLKILTESGKSALFKAVTAKSKLLKEHAAKLDAYVKDKFGDSMVNLTD